MKLKRKLKGGNEGKGRENEGKRRWNEGKEGGMKVRKGE